MDSSPSSRRSHTAQSGNLLETMAQVRYLRGSASLKYLFTGIREGVLLDRVGDLKCH